MLYRFRKSLGPLAFDLMSYHPSILSAWAAVLLRKSRSATFPDVSGQKAKLVDDCGANRNLLVRVCGHGVALS
jgi:hypothetical protein